MMRDAAGRSRGESPAEMTGVAVAARASRMGDLASHAANPLAGSVLGQLYLRWQYLPRHGGIYALAPEMYEAGHWYGGVVLRHSIVMGYALDKFGFSGGASCREDFPDDVANQIKADFRDTYRVLVDNGLAVARATYDLAVDRLDMGQAQALIMPIKIGLRSLRIMWRQAFDRSCRI